MQPPVGSRMVHARLAMDCKAANMCFVNEGLRPWMTGWLVSIPLEGLVDKHALRHRPGVVQFRKDQILLRRQRIVSARRCKIPRRRFRNCASEGIKEKPVEVEPMSFVGFVGAIHAVRIKLAGTDSRTPDVPYVAGTVVS